MFVSLAKLIELGSAEVRLMAIATDEVDDVVRRWNSLAARKQSRRAAWATEDREAVLAALRSTRGQGGRPIPEPVIT